MKVLVTGGAGFIGSRLLKRLIDRGDKVICVDNFNAQYSSKIKRHNLEPFNNKSNFKLLKGDICNFVFLKHVFEKTRPERVVHAAARTGVRKSIIKPKLYERVNVGGTLNLLKLSTEFNVSNFVYLSSSSVYGANKKIPFSELDLVDRPISPYGASKRAAELLCFTYHYLYKLNINILRPFTVYGPAVRPDMASFLFTKWLDEGQDIRRFGSGNTQRDYTYVDDVVSGIILALDKVFAYEIFNLASSYPIKLNDFILLIEKELGKKSKIKEYAMPAGDLSITHANINKAKNMLSYSPKVTINKGVKKLIKWYQLHKNLYK